MITWALEADFDRNGSYETNLTPFVVKPSNGITISRGMDEQGYYRVSSFEVELDNSDGRFSPRNAASPYYGRLNPDVPIHLTAELNSVTYTIWTGYIGRYTRKSTDREVPTCVLQCWDIAHYLEQSPTVNLTVAQRTSDAALEAVTTALGLGSGDIDFDAGELTIPLHFALASSALQAMMDVVRSEPGIFYVNALGQFRFEARNARLGVSEDDTWGDGTDVLPNAINDLTDDFDYVSSVRVRTTVLRTGQADVEIFRFSRGASTKPAADSLELAAGEVYEREFTGISGYVAITAPVAGTDYAANTAANGSGTDKTSALTVTVTDLGGGRFRLRLANTDAGAIFVTLFRLRGQPVEFYADRPEAHIEKPVTGRPVGRDVAVDLPFGDDAVYRPVSYAAQLLYTYRWPIQRLKLRFQTKLAEHLALELGDLVRYTDGAMGEQGSYSDDWYYVAALEYHIPTEWEGLEFFLDVTLEPSHIYRNLDRIAFDLFTRANGALGTSTNGKAWAGATNVTIVSGAARANSDGLQMPTLDLGAGATDQVVEVTMNAIGATDEVGVVFGYVDADNQYRAYLDHDAAELVLEKNVATTVTELARVAFTIGSGHELRVLFQGGRIRVYADFALWIDVEDTSLTTGTRAGLFALNASGTTTFDDFYAQGL